MFPTSVPKKLTTEKWFLKEASPFTSSTLSVKIGKFADDIKSLFKSFDTPYVINQDLSSEYTFIIDRELRLRGRKDDEDTKGGRLYGYKTSSVNDLKNKMKKDLEIIYYQLKKSIEKEKRFKRKI